MAFARHATAQRPQYVRGTHLSSVKYLNNARWLQVTVEDGFRERLFKSWKCLEVRTGREIAKGELGKRVAEVRGHPGWKGGGASITPVHQTTVGRWFKDSMPDGDTIAALAQVLEVDPGWLMFGDQSEAPEPSEISRNQPDPPGGAQRTG